MFFIPWWISDTSDFINSVSNWSWVKKLEVVYAVSQWDFPWIITAFFTTCDFKNKIKIGWGIFSTFWETRDFLRFKECFRELSKTKNTVQNVSIFIINTDIIIDWVISIFLRFSGKESEFGLKSSKRLFATKFITILLKDEVFQVQNIANS